ncbi:DinB family protein [Allomuricauda sp. SCSIO 65647]|uniref:DinB family protein n=1 Tax=Allomuricauda sp. SCSIO 65647 TaxID=2908843 RepID=UPI001F3D001F|nr:DinB family protein [Muricauda sp. SCSIO 65647]UJH68385.1 DinB family protein [Muricauda sp. SCSIO 65647]
MHSKQGLKTDEMTEIQILVNQTKNAFEWTNKLIAPVPTEKWEILADGIGSNLSWQVGHQIISIYYHTILTTVGHDFELIEKLNLRGYTEMSGYDTFAKDMIGETKPEQLKEHLEYMQRHSLSVIESLSVNDLHKAVEPTKVPHPIAKTKFEAIDWNIKHTMWHCGQIATWKRIVDHPHDFGLKKPG